MKFTCVTRKLPIGVSLGSSLRSTFPSRFLKPWADLMPELVTETIETKSSGALTLSIEMPEALEADVAQLLREMADELAPRTGPQK